MLSDVYQGREMDGFVVIVVGITFIPSMVISDGLFLLVVFIAVPV